MKFFRASYDSRNFCFEAYAETEAKARAILIAGLTEHGNQYNLESDWYLYQGWDDIQVTDYVLGKAYRDRDIVPITDHEHLFEIHKKENANV